jgi:hypothetical protein
MTSLIDTVLPAIRMVSRHQRVELFVRGEAIAPTSGEGDVKIINVLDVLPFEEFLARWYEFGIDVLIHPPGITGNAPYKCNTILLTAWYLGAIPIVDDEPAFRDLDQRDGVLKARHVNNWRDAILAASTPERRSELQKHLTATVMNLFDPERNDGVLSSVFATVPRDFVSIVERQPPFIERVITVPSPEPLIRSAKRPAFQRIVRELARFKKRRLKLGATLWSLR